VRAVKSGWATLVLLTGLVLLITMPAFDFVGTEAWFAQMVSSTNHRFTSGTLGVNIENVTWLGPAHDLRPGETAVLQFDVVSIGNLSLDYVVLPSVGGDSANGDTPVYVREIRIDDGEASLSGSSGRDPRDTVQVLVALPEDAGPEYQRRMGNLEVTVHARQQLPEEARP
jgi:hypothetical protein